MHWRLILLLFAATCGSLQAQSGKALKIVKQVYGPLNEPLVMAQFGDAQTLPRDAEFGHVRKTWLRVILGKPGPAKGTFIAYRYGCVRDCGPLQAEFRFPSRESGEVITRTDTLKTRG